MPQKLNKAGKMQDYIPAGNGDPSGEYGTSKGTNKNFTTSDKKKTEANVITENKSVVVGNKGKKLEPKYSNQLLSIEKYVKEAGLSDDYIDKLSKKFSKYGELRDTDELLNVADLDNAVKELKDNKANIIDNDLTGKKEEEQIDRLDTPEKKETFKEALTKALENAKKEYDKNKEDGGTANLDSCEIYIKNANLKTLENLVSQVDPSLKIMKWDNGVYHIIGYSKGQGNLRTRMVEAFEKTLNDYGFKTYVYSQAD